jgi:hypothetical protein
MRWLILAKKFLVEYYYTIDDDIEVTAQQIKESLVELQSRKEDIPGVTMEVGEVWDL